MSKFFDETIQGLLEAVAIEKGEIPLVEKSNMLAKTFIAANAEKKLIENIIKKSKTKIRSRYDPYSNTWTWRCW